MTIFNQHLTYLKVGDRLINPSQITAVHLYCLDEEAPSTNSTNKLCIFFHDGDYEMFDDSEADILRAYFLHGSRSIDLNNLYGTTTPGGTK